MIENSSEIPLKDIKDLSLTSESMEFSANSNISSLVELQSNDVIHLESTIDSNFVVTKEITELITNNDGNLSVDLS